MDGDHSLALPFLTDDPAFARGVEVGILWEQMKAGAALSGWYHRENQDQILLMLSRARWAVDECEPLDDTYFTLTAHKEGE